MINPVQVTSFLKNRVSDHRKKTVEEVASIKREGEEIRRLQMQYEMEKARLAEVAREEKTLMVADFKRQMDDVQKMRQIEDLRIEVAFSFLLYIHVYTVLQEGR